jgi:hypothetical protein
MVKPLSQPHRSSLLARYQECMVRLPNDMALASVDSLGLEVAHLE